YLPAQLRRTRLPRILGGYPTEVFVMFTGLRVTHDIQMRLMFFHRSEQFAAPAQLMLNLLAPHLLLRYRDTAARHVQMLLTERQLPVLRLAAHGNSRSEIARRLQLSPGTVR